MKKVIDSHIHLDQYTTSDQTKIIKNLADDDVTTLITVSRDLNSSLKNLHLSRKHSRIYPAFGYHPEQKLLTEKELDELIQFIEQNESEMIAIGEVGLPYYLLKDQRMIQRPPYVELLEEFIRQAAIYNRPIILHAVYEDALTALHLLEKYSIKKAHFHWFKGDQYTIDHMIANKYFISITPDIVYKQRTRELVEYYPIELMMVETDGPWPFEGPFKGKLTHPKMIHLTIEHIAKTKHLSLKETYHTLYENTLHFYNLK